MIGKLAAASTGLGGLALAGLLAAQAPAPASNSAPDSSHGPGAKGADAAKGLTAVAGLTVGHHTLTERPTGCTVILTGADGMIAGVDVRGGAPGTRDIELLDPSNSVARVHAVVLSGGSAFGLDTASGVMRYLDERKIGFKIAGTQVPIVPAAILMDLGFGGKPEVRPGPDCGYRAASAATADAVTEGNIGAGAGATVGKLSEPRRPMKAGLGSAALVLPDGLVVAALVAVNAVGDVIDPKTGQVIAGVRTADGTHLADARVLLRSGAAFAARPGENTTLGVVATNATLTKAQARKVAQMAHDGFARAISPIHTPADGDTIFTIAAGTRAGEPDILRIGALAADVMSEAVVRGALTAKTSGGLPAARDLATAQPSR
jgi:L-aminopeptidase/D-esterase-like protein